MEWDLASCKKPLDKSRSFMEGWLDARAMLDHRIGFLPMSLGVA